jgi:transposase
MRGNAESGGRRLSGRTRHANVWLRRTLAEVANVASRMKGTYLAAQYRRIAARRGKGRAVVAVGHSVLVAIYHMLTRCSPAGSPTASSEHSTSTSMGASTSSGASCTG